MGPRRSRVSGAAKLHSDIFYLITFGSVIFKKVMKIQRPRQDKYLAANPAEIRSEFEAQKVVRYNDLT
jgi:hypothetical protein